MCKNYEAVTKVVDNTISTIVPDVHEFVYKVIDINESRCNNLIKSLIAIYTEELDMKDEKITLSFNDINFISKFKYVAEPVFTQLIKDKKWDFNLIRNSIKEIFEQILHEMIVDITKNIKSAEDTELIQIYANRIEKIKNTKELIDPVLDFIMCIIKSKMVVSMINPIKDSLLEAYNKNNPFAFISIEEYSGINGDNIRKFVKAIKPFIK